MKATEAILAGVFAGGGSGGGGGGTGFMIVHCNEETKTLDKTFIEIYNAIKAGTPVFVSRILDEDAYEVGLYIMYNTWVDVDDTGMYAIDANDGRSYMAATVNDYPVDYYVDD